MAASRRTLLASGIASLAAPALVGAARAETATVTLKLHHASSAVSCAHVNFLVPWARNVETQSGGRVHIDIFPSMQLGGQPAALLDQARDRVADIVWAMPSKTPGRFPKSELFELPFVSPRRALVGSKAMEDFAGEFLQDEFHEFQPICFSCADRGILHAARPIETITALSGLRLDVRTRFAGQAVQALGARAVPMPTGQLELAITRRLVDGCVVPWDMVPALRLDELLNCHTDFADTTLSTTAYVLAMNKAVYQKLPADLRKVIDDNSGQIAAGMAGAMWDLQATAVADMVIGRGDRVITLAPDVVVHWRKATAPVVDGWIKDMKARKIDGAKLLTSARSLFEKYASLPEPQPPAPPKPPQPAQPPVEAKVETHPPAQARVAAKPPPTPAPPPSPNVVPAKPVALPHAAAAKPAASAQSPPWWEFWKTAPASAPAPTASAAPVASRSPSTHWWQFWKSATPHQSASTVSAPVVPAAPPAPAPAAPAAPPVAVVAKPAAVPPPPPPQTLNIPL